jgi:ribonuclease HI
MPVQCEAQLRTKADAFIKILQQSNVPVQLEDVAYHDFNAMLRLTDKGNIHIYYSPKNRAYKLGLHQLKDDSLKSTIEMCWDAITPQKPIPAPPDAPQLAYQAYVDGSFQGGVVGYGLVILKDGEKVYQESGAIHQFTEHQQITGELGATMRVIRWCEQNNVPEIQIFYDYNGIEKWATGAWRTHTESTQAYQKFMRNTSVNVIWQKVKSHSGDQWNDIADELAKQGSQSGEPKPNADNPLLIELEKTALEFVTYLNEHAIHAEFLKIYNGMFARITLKNGLFDLYNTQKKPLSPVLSKFKDQALKKRIETLWEQFRNHPK